MRRDGGDGADQFVVVDGLAASGGYIAAIAADHIVAQETALVGSIGVIFQYPNFGDALKSLGIRVEEIKSTPLKAAPNGFEPTSPEARAAIEAIVSDSYAFSNKALGVSDPIVASFPFVAGLVVVAAWLLGRLPLSHFQLNGLAFLLATTLAEFFLTIWIRIVVNRRAVAVDAR